MGLYEDYNKYHKDIEREVKFTLFDKNFLIEAFNHSRKLEQTIHELTLHIQELDDRLRKLEGGRTHE